MQRGSFVDLLIGQIVTLGVLWLSDYELRWLVYVAIALCISLFAGLLYRPTRWVAAAFTLPVLAVLVVLFAQFVEWNPA